MTEIKNLEVMPPPTTGMVPVKPPEISVNENEAAQILEELGLVKIGQPTVGQAPKEAVGVNIQKQIRLGIFSEDVGGVRLRGGALLIAERVALNHMLRLEAQANKADSAQEVKEMTYPIGFLLGKIAGTSKGKVVVISAPVVDDVNRQQSWTPGEKLIPSKVA